MRSTRRFIKSLGLRHVLQIAQQVGRLIPIGNGTVVRGYNLRQLPGSGYQVAVIAVIVRYTVFGSVDSAKLVTASVRSNQAEFIKKTVIIALCSPRPRFNLVT